MEHVVLSPSVGGVSVDAPGSYIRDRLRRLGDQRGALLGVLKPFLRYSTEEVLRRRSAAALMGKAADAELYAPLKGAMLSLRDAWTASAATLETVATEHVDKRALAAIAVYDVVAVTPVGRMCDDREAAFHDAKAAVDSFNAARLKSSSGRAMMDVEHRAIAARRRAHNTHVLFEENSQLFEYQRVSDSKAWLQQVIMAEMAFHCTCLESLTTALQALSAVDADAAMDVMRDNLIHAAVARSDVAAAAGVHSVPFQGIAVPPELHTAAAAFAGTVQAAPPEGIKATSTSIAHASATSPAPLQPSSNTVGSAPVGVTITRIAAASEEAATFAVSTRAGIPRATSREPSLPRSAATPPQQDSPSMHAPSVITVPSLAAGTLTLVTSTPMAAAGSMPPTTASEVSAAASSSSDVHATPHGTVIALPMPPVAAVVTEPDIVDAVIAVPAAATTSVTPSSTVTTPAEQQPRRASTGGGMFARLFGKRSPSPASAAATTTTAASSVVAAASPATQVTTVDYGGVQTVQAVAPTAAALGVLEPA